jgi:hypothetical protein
MPERAPPATIFLPEQDAPATAGRSGYFVPVAAVRTLYAQGTFQGGVMQDVIEHTLVT